MARLDKLIPVWSKLSPSFPMSQRFAMSTVSAQSKGKLDGKTAVVTASTDGIGFAIAQSLAENGANVMISSRKEKNVAEAVGKLKALGLKQVEGVVCHVAKASDRNNLFNKTIEKFGKLDILVSNAAANPAAGPVLDCDEDVWDKIFEINVKSAYLLAKSAVPLLRQSGGGSIIFVSSIAGLNPMPLLGAYSVSKTALLGLTKAASLDLGVDNIRVNCLAPGVIDTKFSSALTSSKDSLEYAINQTALRRLGRPKEMGEVVAFLCSDDASYITGETIAATGGMPSRL